MANTTPEQDGTEKSRSGFLKAALDWLKHALTHNLLLKLLALVLALCVWAGLISQDASLTREKTFNDVTISVTGTETLKRNGYIVVSDLTDALSGFTVKASVPQLQYSSATVSSYNPRLELSRITGEGTQELKVITTSTTTLGSVTEVSPSTVTVEVEEYVTRYRIPVSITTTGSLPKGYWSSTASTDPPLVAVSGPKSQVEQVVRAEATLDLDTLPAQEGTVRTAAPLRLIDSDGNEIDSSLIEITSESVLVDSIVVEQTLYSTKKLYIDDETVVSGTPADGYEIKSIIISPSYVTVAGNAENLDVLDSYFLDSVISVEDATESVSTTIRLRKPSELQYVSTDTVTVMVEIGPVMQEKEYAGCAVSLVGKGSQLDAVLSTEKVDVLCYAEELWLRKLKAGSITVTADVSGLAAGTWEVPLKVTAADAPDSTLWYTTPETVTVTLTDKEQ